MKKERRWKGDGWKKSNQRELNDEKKLRKERGRREGRTKAELAWLRKSPAKDEGEARGSYCVSHSSSLDTTSLRECGINQKPTQYQPL